MSVRRHIPKIVGTLVVLGVGALMVNVVRDFLNTPEEPPRKGPQQVTLITPPPPPPPPPQERPPEPEIEDEVELEESEPVDDLPEEASNDEPPPGADLGIDAEGGAGSDSFGLIGRKGGRGLLDGAGNPSRYYANQLSREIENALQDHDAVRRRSYSVGINVWVSSDGRISRAELTTTTGSRETDALLIEAIMGARTAALRPPADMEQPIRLRISSQL